MIFHQLPDPSHVVGHVNGVQLICQETVAEVHPLFLASGIDGDDSRIHHHHHPHNQIMFLQDHVGDQRDQIKSFLLAATQLHHHHQQVGPGEHGAEMTKGNAENAMVKNTSCCPGKIEQV